jgi:predicted porin
MNNSLLQKNNTTFGFPCCALTVVDNASLNSLHLGGVFKVAGHGGHITYKPMRSLTIMQKKLIALAITAAFSAPAFADTSVYGLVDGGFGSKAVTTIGAPDVKVTTTGVLYSQDQTTRVGVKNSEDLDGGMKAMFQLEMGLTSGFGATAAIKPDRVLTGGLDFGQGTTLTIGQMSTPFRGIVYGNDAMYGANFVGNLITQDSSLTSRHVAAVVAHNFGAVTGTLGFMDTTVATDGVADNKTDTGFEATVVFKQDMLSVSGGYRSTKDTVATGPTPTTDTKTTDLILAANFDMGMAKLYGQFAQAKAEESVASTTNKRTYETVGVNVPFTPDLAGYVELGNGKHDTGAATSPKYSAYAVGVHYALSKATFGYAHFGSSKEDTVTKTDQYGVGLVHSF